MTQNAKNKLFFFVFTAVWGVLILCNLIAPKQTFSESENRYLKEFPVFTVPTLLDGQFMDDVNTWLNDHFVARPMWVSGQTLMEYALGKREVNAVYLGRRALLGNVAQPDGQFTAQNIAGINAFAARFEKPAYLLLVPSSTAVQQQNLPAFAKGWDEKTYIADVGAQLSPAVTPVPLFDDLYEQREQYLYYRTDHHWTSTGAGIAYDRLAAVLGLSPRSEQAVSAVCASDNFRGTFHSKTGFPLVAPDQLEVLSRGRAVSYEVFTGSETLQYDSIYFDEYLEKKDQYSYFLGPVQPVVTIHTEADTTRSLLIFKDSYAHSLAPMLLDAYREIRLVDLRYLGPAEIDQVVDVQAYDEALFLYSTDVFSHQPGPALLQNAS